MNEINFNKIHENMIHEKIKKIERNVKSIKEIHSKIREMRGILSESFNTFDEAIKFIYKNEEAFNIEEIEKTIDCIKTLIDHLSPQMIMGIGTEDDIKLNFPKIKISLTKLLPTVEELHCLVYIKLTSNRLDAMNEFIAKTNINLGNLSNSISDMQGSCKELTTNVEAEIEKSTNLFKEFSNTVKKYSSQIEIMTEEEAGAYMAKTYLDRSSRENKWAHGFRILAAAIMLGVLAFNCWVTYDFITKNTQNAPVTLFYIALTFLLLIPAVYFAREANKHRQTELLYLKISQDLTSILPFIATFPEEEKIKLKTAISMLVFSTNNQNLKNDEPAFTHDLILKALETITKK